MKVIKILIFVIIGILVVGLGLGAYVYFCTDTFKTNKEIFYNYTTSEQIAKLFDFESIEQTLARLKSENSELNMNTDINMNISELNFSHNSIMSLKSKNYPVDNKSEFELTFGDANKNDIFEINGVYNKDKLGISFKDITKKYIVLELEEKRLNAFLGNMGTSKSELGMNFSNSNVEEAFEETKFAITDLFKKIAEQTKKENYSNLGKEELEFNGTNIEAKVYELKLNEEEIKQIYSSIDNKNASKIIEFLKEKLGSSFSQIIYIYEGNLVKTEISLNGEKFKVKIVKNLEMPNNKLTIEIVESGRMQLIIDIFKNSNEKYLVEFEITDNEDTENKILVNMDVDIKFNTNNTISKLTDENSVIINDMSAEEIAQIAETVVKMTEEKEGIEDTIIGIFQSIIEISIDNIEIEQPAQ